MLINILSIIPVFKGDSGQSTFGNHYAPKSDQPPPNLHFGYTPVQPAGQPTLSGNGYQTNYPYSPDFLPANGGQPTFTGEFENSQPQPNTVWITLNQPVNQYGIGPSLFIYRETKCSRSFRLVFSFIFCVMFIAVFSFIAYNIVTSIYRSNNSANSMNISPSGNTAEWTFPDSVVVKNL